jgi:hypothetical protein
MIPFFLGFLTCLTTFFRSRCNLSIEIIALRQQLGILDPAQLLGLDKPALITVLYLLRIASTLRIATPMEAWNGPFGLNSTVSVPA